MVYSHYFFLNRINLQNNKRLGNITYACIMDYYFMFLNSQKYVEGYVTVEIL